MMNETNQLKSAIKLSIAGLNVSIACEDALLAQQLAARYREFPAEGEALVAVSIHLLGRQDAPAFLDADLEFREGAAYFNAPAYQGYIDLDQGLGKLDLNSSRPLEEIDYFLRVVYACLAFREGGMLFHAAGILHRGQGILFLGRSGSGKTTVSRLSREDVILNDDLVALFPEGSGWRVHATPFWNPSQVQPSAQSAPLAGMFRLMQDREVFAEKLGAGEALAELVASAPVIAGDPGLSIPLLQRCSSLLAEIPVYRLHFLPDASFWPVVETLLPSSRGREEI